MFFYLRNLYVGKFASNFSYIQTVRSMARGPMQKNLATSVVGPLFATLTYMGVFNTAHELRERGLSDKPLKPLDQQGVHFEQFYSAQSAGGAEIKWSTIEE